MCIREVLKFSKVHKVQQFAEPPTRSPRMILDFLYNIFGKAPPPFRNLLNFMHLWNLELYLGTQVPPPCDGKYICQTENLESSEKDTFNKSWHTI